MTVAQKRKAISLAGKITSKKIAKRLGVSSSNLKRSLPGVSFMSFNKWKRNPDLVRKVINYYFKHGKPATVKKFPDVNVKVIVDRPEYYGIKRVYRQIRWTDNQIVEAVKMAGLIPFDDQAKFFNRPRAHAGSIRSLWMKRFKLGGGNLNGMCHWNAKNFVTNKARYIKPIGSSRKGEKVEFRRLILWVDMQKVLKPDAPEFVRDAVKAMADFQRWIWKTNNPKPLIMKMIKERST
ncbi:MAG: hypothetical protein ACXU9U_05480 [Parachlamydiaceae bacterium]